MDTAKGTSRHITSSQGLGAVLPDRPVRAGGRTPFEAMKNPRKCRSGEPPPGILTGIEQLRKQTSAYGHAFTIRSRSGAFGAYPAAGSPRTCTRARASGRRGRRRVRSVITEPATTTLRSAARPRARRRKQLGAPDHQQHEAHPEGERADPWAVGSGNTTDTVPAGNRARGAAPPRRRSAPGLRRSLTAQAWLRGSDRAGPA